MLLSDQLARLAALQRRAVAQQVAATTAPPADELETMIEAQTKSINSLVDSQRSMLQMLTSMQGRLAEVDQRVRQLENENEQRRAAARVGLNVDAPVFRPKSTR